MENNESKAPDQQKDQKTIGVFFGGRSPEHDVSIITGQLVIAGLKKLGKKVMPVYVSKDGEWFINEKLGSIDFFKKKWFERELKMLPRYTLDLDRSVGKMVFWKLCGKALLASLSLF